MCAQLRIFWPDDIGRAKVPQIPTLTQFYEAYVLPCVRAPRGRAEGTIEQDRIALRHWERVTGDPPLDAITQQTCAQFMAGISDKSPATRRKIAVHLQFILDHAGPRDRRHRSAAQVVDFVPFLERPEFASREPEPAFTLHEIGLLIDAARRISPARPISIIDQPLWWASLIRFAWHTGLRRMNILNAHWAWLRSDGWLEIPSSRYKQNKTQRRFYLSEAARTAIYRVRSKEGRLLAWNGSLSHFRKKWNQLKAVLPKGRRFGLKAIRRAALTWLAERNPLVARLVAGHRRLDVLEDFYVQREVVIQLLESMPIPKGWDV